jgi:hypothetical protein
LTGVEVGAIVGGTGVRAGKRTGVRRFVASAVIAALVIVAATTTFPGLAGSAVVGPDARTRPQLNPGQFAELSTGIVLVRALTCSGKWFSEGTGFLIGESVVMTARHVLKGACRIRIDSANRWIEAKGWNYWHHGGKSDETAADVATIRLASPATGHLFALRTSSVAVGANLATLGHPLGNSLSITQGKVYAKGRLFGIPILAVKLLGAEGASGAPLVDNAGNVAGILQIGLGHPDFLGQNTSGVILGIDLPSWWPTARRDLCRAYPAGGILGCPTSAPKPPPPPPPPPPVPTPTPSPSQTYTDPTGDSQSAPDVTTVTVSNDAAGNTTFRVTIANRPALAPDDAVLIWLDSDRNPSTGSYGTDYVVAIAASGSELLKWDGTDFVRYQHGPFSGSFSAGVATFIVNRVDIGNPASFDFWAGGSNGTGATFVFDSAPDQGLWTYTIG